MSKLKMNENQLNCVVCKNHFDDDHHLPVALPACGHTFCGLCLVTLYDQSDCNAFHCPICRKLHEGTDPKELPCNYAILNLLNNDHQQQDDQQRNDGDSSSNKVPPSDGSTKMKIMKGLGYTAAATGGAMAMVAVAPIVLTGIGFTSAGVAAGSYAATMMSSAAIANGGGIAAGSLVAALQSAGAAGIGATATAGLASAGAAIGTGFAKLIHWTHGDKDKAKNDGTSQSGHSEGDDSKKYNEDSQDDDSKDYKNDEKEDKGDSDKDCNDGDKK